MMAVWGLDMTIIATALVAITSHFNAVSDIGWVTSIMFTVQVSLHEKEREMNPPRNNLDRSFDVLREASERHASKNHSPRCCCDIPFGELVLRRRSLHQLSDFREGCGWCGGYRTLGFNIGNHRSCSVYSFIHHLLSQP